MRSCTIWLVVAAVTVVHGSAGAQGSLAQLRLEAPPTQTLFCSVGERVRLSLLGLDEKQTRTPLDSYKVRIRSSNDCL